MYSLASILDPPSEEMGKGPLDALASTLVDSDVSTAGRNHQAGERSS